MAIKRANHTTTDELNDTFPSETDSDNENNATQSIDDFLDAEDTVSPEEESDYQQLHPPSGDWTKDNTFNVKFVCKEGDSLPGDRNPQGRSVFNVSGKPAVRVVNGQDFQPFLMFQCSPDKRTWENEKGESGLDSSYKMWFHVKDLFIAIYGRKHKTLGEIKRMLESDDYIVNTYKGNDGPRVQSIKPIRKNKQG